MQQVSIGIDQTAQQKLAEAIARIQQKKEEADMRGAGFSEPPPPYPGQSRGGDGGYRGRDDYRSRDYASSRGGGGTTVGGIQDGETTEETGVPGGGRKMDHRKERSADHVRVKDVHNHVTGPDVFSGLRQMISPCGPCLVAGTQQMKHATPGPEEICFATD